MSGRYCQPKYCQPKAHSTVGGQFLWDMRTASHDQRGRLVALSILLAKRTGKQNIAY
jgi:hypothetical protein